MYAIILIATSAAFQTAGAHAQGSVQRIALKSGESADLSPVYWVTNCKSIMLGLAEIEILEGPPELTLSIREEMVLPAGKTAQTAYLAAPLWPRPKRFKRRRKPSSHIV
jgi:hypothetical protein